MPFHRHASKDSTAEQMQAATEVLFERGLLAPWFFRYRVQQEMARSKRSGHPMCAVVMKPQFLERERLSAEAARLSAAATVESLRATELATWIDDHRIALILLDTDERGAHIAVERLRGELWIRSRHARALKWLIDPPIDAASFDSVDALWGKLRAA
jgi:hypothetical protein